MQRPIKSKSAPKSVSGAEGQMCGALSKPSKPIIPQVTHPPKLKDGKLLPSKYAKPPITAPTAFRKEERENPSLKEGVSKSDDTITRLSSSHTVKFPNAKYHPLPQEGKREQSSVKDTKHPCPSLGTQNRDKTGISKPNHSKDSPRKDNTTLLEDQGKSARHWQTKSKPVAESTAHQSEETNEGLPRRPPMKAGSGEREIKPARDSTTKVSRGKEHDEEIISIPDVKPKMSIIKKAGLCKFFKQVCSFCIQNTSRIIVFLLRMITCICLSEFRFQPFPDTNRRKCPDKMRPSAQKILDTSEMDVLITEMVNKKIIRHSDNPKKDIKNFFEKEVKMEQKDIDIALNHFRWLRGKIIGILNSEMNFGTWEFCNAGSHFDGTKVARPNEFDCTIFPVLQTKLVAEFDDTCEGGACKVKVVGDVDENEVDLQLFLEGSYVNSTKFKEYVFKKLERVIQTVRKLKDARKFDFTQSFAVTYEGIPSEQGIKSIDIDFVPSLNIKPWPPKNISRDVKKVIQVPSKATAVQRKGFNVTAKHWQHAKDPNLLWQVSFCYAEKVITKHANKVIWKPSLRTLKRVLEIAKGNSDSCAKSNSQELLQIQQAVTYVQEQKPELRSSRLTTYHIRTLMWWHLYELTLGEHVWVTDTMATRFQECLQKFQKMMTGEMVVPHFFLPQIKNILPHMLETERAFLYVIARTTEVIFSKEKWLSKLDKH